MDTFLRLTELCILDKDWPGAAQNAERFLAVNPLLAQPYHSLAKAREILGQPKRAIRAYETMLLLDPPDPAEAHFRLAHLLHQAADPAAKRHVLQALEEAPRFRDAHKLLLEISGNPQTNSDKTAPPEQQKNP